MVLLGKAIDGRRVNQGGLATSLGGRVAIKKHIFGGMGCLGEFVMKGNGLIGWAGVEVLLCVWRTRRRSSVSVYSHWNTKREATLALRIDFSFLLQTFRSL